MKLNHGLAITLVMALLGKSSWSQTTSPSRQPATTTGQMSADLETRTLPELKFDGVALDDVMAFLGDVAGPQFSPTVVRDPGVPNDYPAITMRARNITIPQFLEFLQRAYGIDSTKIAGPAGPIYLVTIKLDDRVKAYLSSGTTSHTGSTFRVFNISDVTQRLATTRQPNPGADQYKQAMNDVLSLVQAALEQTSRNVRERPTLKVHEGTQVLLFTGTPAQEQIVGDVLETLTKQDAERFSEQNQRISELNRQNSNLTTSLGNSELTVQQLRERVKTLEKEIDARSASAVQSLSTTRPKE